MSVTINGTDGLTFNDASTQNTAATGFGFKNRIINGAMKIAQRGTSSSAGGYSCLDRYYFNTTGTAPTASQQTATVNGITANVMQVAGVAGNTAQNIQQKIESKNCYDLVGQDVTISFWTYQTTGSAFNLNTGLYYANSVDTFGPTTLISTNTTSIPNAVWTYVSFTISSLPANAANGLMLQLFSNSPALTSGVFQFAFLQLEKGSTATSFDYRPYGTELALCQRYYYKIFPGATSKLLSTSGVAYTTTNAQCLGQFPVTMRIAPTALEQSGIANQYASGSLGIGAPTCTAVPLFNGVTTDTVWNVTATVASGLTVGYSAIIRTDATNGAGAYLAWSAEL